jgi:uncharacterized protein (TIGR03435 family)
LNSQFIHGLTPRRLAEDNRGPDPNRRKRGAVSRADAEDAAMRHRTQLTPVGLVMVLLGLVSGIQAQGARFEAASVKANTSGDGRMSMGMRGRTYTAINTPLRWVIADAFDLTLQRDRLIGGPAWLTDERYDIVASLPDGSERRQLPEMLQAMLSDRFHLKTHREVHDSPIFALVVVRDDGRLGRGLRKAAVDCDALRAAGTPPPIPAPGQEAPCRSQIDASILGRGQSLATLARMLVQFAGRSVVDRTGLRGGYDFDLRLPASDAARPPLGQAPVPAANDSAGGIFTAVQEELGLKLEPARGPVEVVVIDSIERLVAN